MKQIVLTPRQREKLSDYCLDISKLSLGSWVFIGFTPEFGLIQALFTIAGLTFAAIFFILGMYLLKEKLL